jgi:ribonuclease HII
MVGNVELQKLLVMGLSELRERFLGQDRAIPDGLLEALQLDERQGARELARRLIARRSKNLSEGQRLRHLLAHERELWAQGFAWVAGVDEAGVGPLAGPVVAGACILPQDFRPCGIDDSKKLDVFQRAALESEIKERAVAWSIGVSQVEEIDSLNIYHAALLAMRRAVLGLSRQPDHLLVDARKVPELSVPQRSIIHGDALSLTIAAASILAKTARDRMLDELALLHPGYGFELHKGYATPEHFAALERLGACPIHRKSFAPVRQALGLDPVQVELPFATSKRRGAPREC